MSARAPLTRRKRLLFGAITLGLTPVVAVVALFGADVLLHRRYASSAGLNVWGYRGPVVGKKQAGETRIVVLGGSTAFGYGVTWRDAFPTRLQQIIDERMRREMPGRTARVVNLAYNQEGAWSARFTLEDYRYLQYDAVILYTGYNDLAPFNQKVFRRESPVFRLTGYVPILPIVLREKAAAVRHGGSIDVPDGRTRFVAGRGTRLTAASLEFAAGTAEALARQLGRLSDPEAVAQRSADVTCAGRWEFYCTAVHAAVRTALASGARVLVVSEPYISDAHVEQQTVVHRMIASRFPDRGRVRSVTLGRLIDLRDAALAWDGMHLTPAGNERIARALAPVVFEALR
jgi:hypothetical protein